MKDTAAAGLGAEETMRILMVEDSEDDALLLSRALASAVSNMHWERVDSAAAMRDALTRIDWDLIISDHSMPSFSAVEAFRVLKASGSEIPFIIYSGNISHPTAIAAMEEGVHDFVEKGNLERLLPVVRRELKGAANRHAREQAEHHIYRLANYDPLTGLPNRTLFTELAAARLRSLGEAEGSAAIAFIDLDRFMRINNTFGYATGDLLVKQVGRRLASCAGVNALVARFGRDEFAVLFGPLAALASAREFAATLAQAFEAPFTIDHQEFFITLSTGLCVFPEHGEDISRLLVNAESAMFFAKKSGRNNCQLYAPDWNTASTERHAIETCLRRAVVNGELRLQYQPSVDIGTGKVVGTEALVRWQHPVLGMVPPDKFIPLADEMGIINEIGEWVLVEACRQTREWHDRGYDWLTVAVNVSAVQFREAELAGTVAAALRKAGLGSEFLELEITETVLMHDAEATVATLRELKRMGVRISIDDFGTGYSSLAYLKRFPIDTLKIDRTFSRDVTTDRDNAAIVSLFQYRMSLSGGRVSNAK